jgi:Zn-dependent M28 family amino/carboxypeptidase
MVTPDQLRQHVYALTHDIGEHNIYHPAALQAAANYITHQWQQQGYTVTPQSYTVQDLECANLEITCQGNDAGKHCILVGAHYDSVIGSPGANDNGSGIAALLELSKRFINVPINTPIRFVAFVNEEPPFFYWNKMGSMVYAKQARQRGDKIRFMTSLETIGYFLDEPHSQHYPAFLKHFYPDKGNFIAFVSNLSSRRVMRNAVKSFHQHSDFPVEHIATLAMVPGVSWSDHLSFWRNGYKAFMITDTALYRYPYYHTSQDSADKLTYEPFAKLVNGLFLMLQSLANQ